MDLESLFERKMDFVCPSYFTDEFNSLAFGEESEESEAASGAPRAAAVGPRSNPKITSILLALAINIKGRQPATSIKRMPKKSIAWVDLSETNEDEQNVESAVADSVENAFKRYLPPGIKSRVLIDPRSKGLLERARRARAAHRDGRILFYYNGYGVEEPTTMGEFWVFNEKMTYYHPLHVSTLAEKLGDPSIYIFDSFESGNLYKAFLSMKPDDSLSRIAFFSSSHGDTPQTTPLLPIDIFTSCLLTPLRTSINFHILRTLGSKKALMDLPDKLELGDPPSGSFRDRSTPMGILYWIYTAITDSIAWSTVDREDFRKFFRGDGFVSMLYRNFFLAQRVLSRFGVTPRSIPTLPDASKHPLWNLWDNVLEQYIGESGPTQPERISDFNFFTSQLDEFEQLVGTYYPNSDVGSRISRMLPVLAQAITSKDLRKRTLLLLARFTGLGAWAIEEIISLEILPLLLTLLDSSRPTREILFIWAKIMSFRGEFLSGKIGEKLVRRLAKETDRTNKLLLLVILSAIQQNSEVPIPSFEVNQMIRSIIQDPESGPELVEWSCYFLGSVWEKSPEAQQSAVKDNQMYGTLFILRQRTSTVRCASIWALRRLVFSPDRGNALLDTGMFSSISDEDTAQTTDSIDEDQQQLGFNLVTTFYSDFNDSSSRCRLEILLFIVGMMSKYLPQVRDVVQEKSSNFNKDAMTFRYIYELLDRFRNDPVKEISDIASDAISQFQEDSTEAWMDPHFIWQFSQRNDCYPVRAKWFSESVDLHARYLEDTKPVERTLEEFYEIERKRMGINKMLFDLVNIRFGSQNTYWKNLTKRAFPDSVGDFRFFSYDRSLLVAEGARLRHFSFDHRDNVIFKLSGRRKITSIEIANQDSQARNAYILGTSNSDVYVLREDGGILNAWNSSEGGSIVLDWNSSQGELYIARKKNPQYVQVWDATKEIIKSYMYFSKDINSTVHTMMPLNDRVLVVAFENGQIRRLDTRKKVIKSELLPTMDFGKMITGVEVMDSDKLMITTDATTYIYDQRNHSVSKKFQWRKGTVRASSVHRHGEWIVGCLVQTQRRAGDFECMVRGFDGSVVNSMNVTASKQSRKSKEIPRVKFHDYLPSYALSIGNQFYIAKE